MYNPKKISELIKASGTRVKDLYKALGISWNGSVDQLFNKDIRVSKLEKLADYFNVPVDTFFEREARPTQLQIGGVQNKVHHFSVTNSEDAIKALTALLEEKDKRIATLEELVNLYKLQSENARATPIQSTENQ